MVGRGRPRSFDRDAALSAAMNTFWQFGYEGASMSALTEAMGINSPSLYACFGSKEGLFREAVDLYLATEDKKTRSKLSEAPTARDAVQAMLQRTIGNLTDSGCRGCLLVLGDTNASPENAGVHQYLAQRRKEIQAALEERLRRGIAEGDLPSDADVRSIAAFYITVMQGLSLRARDGASREAMTKVADAAMMAWDALIATPAQRKARTAARSRVRK
ncbi:TetR/AcrR family transcriptional regulator [Dongia deserti]|uniref:TetR/AcrR family transcriptional regulator n=1 Tax=Dongia deserti TaxID=2268030 RepID=UPI000E6477CF|nr:TetR/AcrR family transcriptional regulator [Dongia deserti]